MINEQDGKPRNLSETPWFRFLGGLSVVTAVPALILGFPPVQERIFDRNPRIELNLSSELPVFDIQKPMRGLSIVLNGSDINASNESLIASRVVIRNSGKVSVKPNDVSVEDPIGFEVIGGEIVELTGFLGSNSHLQKLTYPKVLDKSITISNSIIIDSKDYIQFDLLIKKKRGLKIDYKPLGKIANSSSIKIIDQRNYSQKQSFLETAFFGSPLIQLCRIIAYFVLGFFILAGFVFLYEKLQDFRENKRKTRQKIIVNNFLASSSQRNKVSDAVAASLYFCLSRYRFQALVSERAALKTSSLMGKISAEPVTLIKTKGPIEPTFDSIVTFLGEGSYAADLWKKSIEQGFNLINSEGTEMQQAYAQSLEAMLAFSNAADPKGKLSTKAVEYHYDDEIKDLEYRVAWSLKD